MRPAPDPATTTAPADRDDGPLLDAIRGGDEAAFDALVVRHHPTLLRVARLWVRDGAVAEEVAQETWVGFLEGLDRFAGRASLRTWLCGIAINVARARARKERRTVPASSLGDKSGDEPAVPPERFQQAGPFAGGWSAPPTPWPDTPERRLLSAELRRRLEAAVATLPETQREVLVLRDVEGWTSEEVCNVLGLSDTNQRVLLHRARSRLRAMLEAHYNGTLDT